MVRVTAAEVREDHGLARTGILHRQDVAAERDTRGLEGVHRVAEVAQAADDGAGGRGLAGVHAGAGECHDRHALGVQRGREVELLGAGARRHADAFAEVGEVEHRAEHARLEGLAEARVDRVAHADHAAHVEDLQHVARGHLLGQVARIAEQRLPVAERADDDVAALDLGLPAAGQLEGVVGARVVEDFHRDQHPLLARDLRADAQLARELRVLGHGADLVGDDGLHLGLPAPAARVCRIPGKERMREYPSASAGVHSPAFSP
jgi:hypothetical protein